MKVSIVSDQKGNIVSVSKFGDIGDKISGIVKAGIVLEAGHTIHEIDLPAELEQSSLLDIHKGFRLDVATGAGKLTKL